jgi:hypothetical protein
MKKLSLFSLLAAVVVMTAGSLNAQTSLVTANVPFAFSAGKTSFPAGEYRVNEISTLGALSIVGRDLGSGIVNSLRTQSSSPSASTKLVFHRYGSHYFLYQIWVQGEESGRELRMTPLEKELASNAMPSAVVIMARK